MYQPTSSSIHPAPPSATPDLTGYRDLHRALLVSAERLTAQLSHPSPDRRRRRALERWFVGYRGEAPAPPPRRGPTCSSRRWLERVPSYHDYSATLDSDHAELDALIDRLGSAIHDTVARRRRRRRTPRRRARRRDRTPRPPRRPPRVRERRHPADVRAPPDRRRVRRTRTASASRASASGKPGSPCRGTCRPSSRTPHVTTWAEAPVAMKILHVLSRRSYERLDRRAFGGRS